MMKKETTRREKELMNLLKKMEGEKDQEKIIKIINSNKEDLNKLRELDLICFVAVIRKLTGEKTTGIIVNQSEKQRILNNFCFG